MIINSKTQKLLSVLSLSAFTLGASLALASSVEAAVRCEIQYGGREVCIRTGKLQVNKKVWDPTQNAWIDNSDFKFAPGATVQFSIEVKNVGDSAFASVRLTDILPSFLVLSSGKLEEEIKDLTPGETETRKIDAKVKAASELPMNVNCDVNVAEAVSGDDRDKDTARVCYAKQELKVLPKAGAGAEGSPLLMLASVVTGLLGLSLIQRKSKVAA